MRRALFDSLRTLRLERESGNGCVELCREPDGTRWTKLRITAPACQRECLAALGQSVPVRLENGVLELLLPWREGLSLRQWLYEQNPTLGQRRDACLSLLEQQLSLRGRLPPCLTALAAEPGNLVNDGTGLFLQYIPNFQSWEPDMTEAQAVRALADVIYQVLAAEWDGRGRVPAEVRLLRLRRSGQSYTNWGQLQRDLAAVPDNPPRAGSILRARARRTLNGLRRVGSILLRVLAVLLFAAALLSLAMAYRQRSIERQSAWPGMPQVGDQDLRSGEGGG
ncbi:MAG: hypothetical protein HDT19_04270 [Oscillibacter sp.]|nr:hypothetical protein [Oscillibacter sp.]